MEVDFAFKKYKQQFCMLNFEMRLLNKNNFVLLFGYIWGVELLNLPYLESGV